MSTNLQAQRRELEERVFGWSNPVGRRMLVRCFLERAACTSGNDRLVDRERVCVGVELAAELRGAARVGASAQRSAGSRGR